MKKKIGTYIALFWALAASPPVHAQLAQPVLRGDWAVKVRTEARLLQAGIERPNDTTAVLNQIEMVRSLRFAPADTEEAKALKPYIDRKLAEATTWAREGRNEEARYAITTTLQTLDGDYPHFDIEIESEPTESNADVLYYDGTIARRLVTSATAQQLATGEYLLRVTKLGYLDAETTLNLVEESIAVVTCTLKAEEERAIAQSVCQKKKAE